MSNNIELQQIRTVDNTTHKKAISYMNHELRTPLNGIIGMTELLLTTDLTKEQREYVDILINSGNEMLDMIDRFVAIARGEIPSQFFENLSADIEHKSDKKVEAGLSESSNQLNILLVEDHTINRRVIKMMLEKLGHNVNAVISGAEAIKALESSHYHLVLMDCQMPDMDGYQATAVIRDFSSAVLNHTIPVIAMTANSMTDERDKCLTSGMDDYMTKPIMVNDLEKVLHKWLPNKL